VSKRSPKKAPADPAVCDSPSPQTGFSSFACQGYHSDGLRISAPVGIESAAVRCITHKKDVIRTTRPFVFKVIFEDDPESMADYAGPAKGRCSVIVEVEPDGTTSALGGHSGDGAAQEFAEDRAPEAALQAIA